MTNNHFNKIISENPDLQGKQISSDVINHLQEQQTASKRLPQSLNEWLARINRRCLAVNQEKTNDTS